MQRSLLTLSIVGALVPASLCGSYAGQTDAGSSDTYHVKFLVHQDPSKRFWQVYVPTGDDPDDIRVIVNVTSDLPPNWPMKRRADEIARRMNELEKSDASWYDHLSASQFNGADVVLPQSAAPGVQWVMTADKGSLERWNYKTTSAMARGIVADLKKAFNDPNVKRALHTKGDVRGAIKEAEKSPRDLFEEAQRFQAAGRTTPALVDYQKAIAADPTYVEAYIELAGIYRNINEVQRAKQQLALAQKNSPSASQAKRIASLQAELTSLSESAK